MLVVHGGAQLCARGSTALTIYSSYKTKKVCAGEDWEVPLLCGQRLEVLHLQVVQWLCEMPLACGLPSASTLGAWLGCRLATRALLLASLMLAISEPFKLGLPVGEVSCGRVEIKFHRKIWWKVCDRSCSSWSCVQAPSPSVPGFLCDIWFKREKFVYI